MQRVLVVSNLPLDANHDDLLQQTKNTNDTIATVWQNNSILFILVSFTRLRA